MFRKKKTKKIVNTYSRDLKELGYFIDEEGRLRTLEGKFQWRFFFFFQEFKRDSYIYPLLTVNAGEPYTFEVKKDREYNEGLYDTLIDILCELAEEKLQKDCGLIKALVPLGATEEDIHSKIFLSQDYMTNDKMIIFIPGTSHKVGIWSRRVLSDSSVMDGSMITYTKRARELGFAIVITNPNEVFWYKGKGVLILPKTSVTFDTIPGSESPEAHVNYVFKNFVIPSAAEKIVVVANSYGGHCAVDAIQNNFDALLDKIKAVEFTASTHSIDFVKSDKMKVWIRERCRNWLMSDQPIGQEVIDPRFGCISVSSGSELNEYVTSTVIDEIFNFIDKRVIKEIWDDVGSDLEEDPELLSREADILIKNEDSYKIFSDNDDKIVFEEAGPVKRLDSEQLNEYLKWRLKDTKNNNKHANTITVDQEVDGSNFLDFTAEDFERWKIPGGPAKDIEKVINELKEICNNIEYPNLLIHFYYAGLSPIDDAIREANRLFDFYSQDL
ncbi:358_t:CDS:10, partial [Funneliformis caledonium]